MTTQRVQAPPINLKERIAAFQQRNVQPRQVSSPLPGSSSSPNTGSLRDKIAQFEQKGAVPAPRGSFGLGAPPPSDVVQARKKGELYGNRIPGVAKSPLSRSGSPLPSSYPERRSRSVSVDFALGSPDISPPYLASTFASSQSSGELLSPPQSPSPNSPDISSPTTSPRKSSFASALEIARRAENASPIGKNGIRESALPRPVSPLLMQRVPPSVFIEEEEVASPTKRLSTSRRMSLGVVDSLAWDSRITTPASEPSVLSQPLPEEPVELNPREKERVSVSLLPVETEGVTRMSFEEMLAALGDDGSVLPEEPPQLPAEEHIEGFARAQEEGLVNLVSETSDSPVVEDIPEPVRQPSFSAPEITVVSFEDPLSTPDTPENSPDDVPPGKPESWFNGSDPVMEVSQEPEESKFIPIIHVPRTPLVVIEAPIEPEHEILTPIAPSKHDLVDSPRSLTPSDEIDARCGENPVDLVTHSPVTSPPGSDPQRHRAYSPDRSFTGTSDESPISSIDDAVGVVEPVIEERQPWRDRLPSITVESVTLPDDVAEIADATTADDNLIHYPIEDGAIRPDRLLRMSRSLGDLPVILESYPRSLPPSPKETTPPSVTFDHVYLGPESPIRPRSISLGQSGIKVDLTKRPSTATGHAEPHTIHSLPEDSTMESEFGTVTLHSYRSPYTESEFTSTAIGRGSKSGSFSAVVHGKVTELPSVFTPVTAIPKPPRTAPRLAPVVHVEPESPGYIELAELLKEAADLERRLLAGDIPDEHRAAAHQSLQAMSKYTAAQEKLNHRPKLSEHGKPIFHRASSSPSAAKTVGRSRSGDVLQSWKGFLRGSGEPRSVPAPTMMVDEPPMPPPKDHRPRYFSGFRKLGNSSSTPAIPGAYPRKSLSTSSEVSSEDSMHGRNRQMSYSDSHGEEEFGAGRRGHGVWREGVHQRNASTLGIAWPTISPKKNGGLSRATSFAEKLWKRGRTKSATSMPEVPGPQNLPMVPPLGSSAGSNEIDRSGGIATDRPACPAQVDTVGAASNSERPVSWGSGSTASPLERLFDAFPSVPQTTPRLTKVGDKGTVAVAEHLGLPKEEVSVSQIPMGPRKDG